MTLAIVVLAAGRGTRYGALKQLAPLGPAGEIVLDYTLYDAAAAGFSRAVLVVADGMVDVMADHLDEFVPSLTVELVVQPVVRAAPLGTTHATIVGAEGLTEPFAVANADDSYGADALATLGDHLRIGDLRMMESRSRPRTPSAALVGFAVDATLSPHGGVSRAVCRVGDDGHLLGVEEHTGVRRDAGRLVSDTATLDATTIVSMNLWGFDPSAVDLFRPISARFAAEHPDDDSELRLPDLVGDLVARGELDVSVLPTASPWLGVTYPEDAHHVRERLATLTNAGVYPSRAISRGERR